MTRLPQDTNTPLTGWDSFWLPKMSTQHPGTWEERGVWESLTRVFLKFPYSSPKSQKWGVGALPGAVITLSLAP